MAKATKALAGSITIDLSPNTDELTKDNQLLALAQQLDVKDDASLDLAARLVVNCGERVTAIEAFFKDMVATAHAAHKTLTSKRGALIKPYEDARELIQNKMKPYRRLQEKQAAEAQEAAQQVHAEEQGDVAAQVRTLRRQGRMTEAKALESSASQIVAPVMQITAPELEGLGERKPWKGTCHTPMELILAIAKGDVALLHEIKDEQVPLIYVNQKVLDHLARTHMKAFNVPGCTAEQDLTFAVRRS